MSTPHMRETTALLQLKLCYYEKCRNVLIIMKRWWTNGGKHRRNKTVDSGVEQTTSGTTRRFIQKETRKTIQITASQMSLVTLVLLATVTLTMLSPCYLIPQPGTEISHGYTLQGPASETRDPKSRCNYRKRWLFPS